jgi:transcription elongation GreA/GreB family factor
MTMEYLSKQRYDEIGAALMGRKVGEIVEAQVPSGTLRLKIESITFA